MQFCTAELRRGAFGQPSVPFLLSRRAHLLTTPKGRWYCLRQPCALRGGCGSCGSLWTMPPSFESAVIVHAVGYVLCFIIKTVVSILETTCRLPAQTCHRQLCRRKGVAVHDTLFFFAKETKIQERKDSENEWQSIILKQRWSAGERDGLPWQLPLI